MKKILIFILLFIASVYLSWAININLWSWEKLENNIWTNLSSVLNKVNISWWDININWKLAVDWKICLDNGNCIWECTWEQFWDNATSSCKAKAGWTAETASKTCKTLKEENPEYINWAYFIDPDWDWWDTPFKAYCNMTLAWGGWTLLATQKDGHYFTISNVDSYDGDWIGKDVNKYSILWKTSLFKWSSYSGQYEFLYRDDTEWKDYRTRVKQSNDISATSSSWCSVLENSIVSPKMSFFACFYRMPWGIPATFNKYSAYWTNWQFGIGQYKWRLTKGLVTWYRSNETNYNVWVGSTKYEFYVR